MSELASSATNRCVREEAQRTRVRQPTHTTHTSENEGTRPTHMGGHHVFRLLTHVRKVRPNTHEVNPIACRATFGIGSYLNRQKKMEVTFAPRPPLGAWRGAGEENERNEREYAENAGDHCTGRA